MQDFVTDLVIRIGVKPICFLALLALGLAMQAGYSRLRRPAKDAEFVGNWRVPAGRWILGVILLVVFIYLGYVISRDPLQ
ncbi:hypothetical protein ETAA8_07640 [Anatilimnocola aggregata]|uniref:Uncharacterized protein n=1 Tax=Anatilimnocola aggregata TaxID=2528021 RepID=A0A517Y630_9BACT|nr:hypothetical protein [Anatilimnocola aggregata]QDU25694.1 hypothetical protein ETAA8_07640 [Anatilimnocola aggregata]